MKAIFQGPHVEVTQHATAFGPLRRPFWWSIFWFGLGIAWTLQAAGASDTTPTATAAAKPERKDSVKIYIRTDLEAVSGIDSMDMIERTGPRYRQCCEHLMADLNAAIDGAFTGGATHVTVLDSRGGGDNFIVEAKEARERIREAARRAVGLVGKGRLLTPIKPMEIVLELHRADSCVGVAVKPGIERLDARTIRWVTTDPLAILP